MKKNFISLITLVTLTCFSCGRSFLEVKPSKKMVVPSTVYDIRALLDNTAVFNASTPYLGEIGSDDYYITDARWNALTVPPQKNAYIWSEDVYEGYEDILDWVLSYERVFYSNLALEGISMIKAKSEAEQQELDYLYGSALFLRSKAFFELAQIFCPSYDSRTSLTDSGIPIRLVSDLNAAIYRNTVKETYDQILSDLEIAKYLLPEQTELKTRPTRAAAMALLSKVYLLTYNYDMALKNAEESLFEYGKIIDFNHLDLNSNFPLTQFNDEVIFHSTMGPATILNQSRLNVMPELYGEYGSEDLRKPVFFTEGSMKTFKGSYGGNVQFFSGLSTNEMVLIKSECLIRLNKIKEGTDVLNLLLKKRYRNDMFQGIQVEDAHTALSMVLKERRKELVFRGIRWSDLRRLNKEGFEIKLERTVNQNKYELMPNDRRYVLPIPDIVVRLSLLEQNPR
jgi:hypothetical protein